MPLSLSSNDCIRLEAALQTLLCPLDYPHVDAWRSAVNRSMKALLGADKAMFTLPADGATLIYSEEYEAKTLKNYPDLVEPFDAKFSILARMRRAKIATYEMVWGPHLEEYYRSAYYNEYIVPNRGFDALAMTVPLGEESAWDALGNLIFHHERRNGPRFGDRGLSLLQLVYPAFQAGVQTYLRHAEHRGTLIRMLDTLKEGILLCDPAGRVLHQNPALTDALGLEPGSERLQQEMRKVALRLARLSWGPEEDRDDLIHVPAVREFRAPDSCYRIRGSYFKRRQGGGESYILVALERATPQLPSQQELRKRFGLTRREAEVVLLLAQRRRNEEIAEALCISPHTARHHTEKVLSKLGIHSRSDVKSAILAERPS